MNSIELRRTGRTTAQLRAACEAATRGDKVMFVVPTIMLFDYCLDLVRKHDLANGSVKVRQGDRVIEFPSGGRVQITVPGHVEMARGFRDLKAVVDHSCFEVLPVHTRMKLARDLDACFAEQL